VERDTFVVVVVVVVVVDIYFLMARNL